MKTFKQLINEIATVIPFPAKASTKPAVQAGETKDNVTQLGTKVPLSSVFKAKPVPEVPVEHEYYSWGRLSRAGNASGSVVMHPEHQRAVLALKKSGQSTSFTDEQDIPWTATRTDDHIHVESKDGMKLKFKYADLLQQK